MNTGLWKMDSGIAATRRPGMTTLGATKKLSSWGYRNLGVDRCVS
jgi:hypothetical protein